MEPRTSRLLVFPHQGARRVLQVADEHLVQPHQAPDKPVRGLISNASHEGLDDAGEQHLANGGAALTPDRRPAFVLGTVGRRLVALRHGSPPIRTAVCLQKGRADSPLTPGHPEVAQATRMGETRVSAPADKPVSLTTKFGHHSMGRAPLPAHPASHGRALALRPAVRQSATACLSEVIHRQPSAWGRRLRDHPRAFRV